MSGVIKTVLKNMLVPCLLVYAPFASAEWRIQPELSKLSYLTSKASAATEINHFRLVDGVITEKGTASLTISLNSVDTGVEIRDERMRNIVFETERFPVANVTAEVDISLYEEMADGETQTATLDTNIGLHGMIVTLPVEFRITKLTNSRLLVH
jgi:polyisoprenoid-binding protein YceI